MIFSRGDILLNFFSPTKSVIRALSKHYTDPVSALYDPIKVFLDIFWKALDISKFVSAGDRIPKVEGESSAPPLNRPLLFWFVSRELLLRL